MVIKKIADKEWNNNKYLIEAIKNNETIKKRVENCLRWFINKAVLYKCCFYLFSLITIILPVASGIIISIPTEVPTIKLLYSILSGLSAIAASVLNLFDFRKKWGLYRNQAEEIKRILSKSAINASTNEETLHQIEESISFTDKCWRDDLDND